MTTEIDPSTSQRKVRTVVRDASVPYQTDTPAMVQMTAKGLLLSYPMLKDWEEIEIIAETRRIIIQPKTPASTERQQVLQALAACGFLPSEESLPVDYTPLSAAEQVELARAFSVGKPLSTIIIEEREGR